MRQVRRAASGTPGRSAPGSPQWGSSRTRRPGALIAERCHSRTEFGRDHGSVLTEDTRAIRCERGIRGQRA